MGGVLGGTYWGEAQLGEMERMEVALYEVVMEGLACEECKK